MWCLCNDHCLDIVIIIWSSINCPTVICLPTVCYLSWEKPLVKPTAPGSSSSYICLQSTFPLHFLFRSIKQKIQKYFAALYFICDLLFQSTTIFWHRYVTSLVLVWPRLAFMFASCLNSIKIWNGDLWNPQNHFWKWPE